MHVIGVKPLSLYKIANLFNSLRITISTGLVSIAMCMYHYNILSLIDILTTWTNNLLYDPNPNNLVVSTTFYFVATKATLFLVQN